ncbi:MAG: hypothetical protein ACP5T0_02720 [Verrucomicrobiia bacterium]
MKTKALILTAAVAVAGAIAASAQTVYSVNVVGYVNVTIKPGFNLIANPLNTTNNTIAALLPNVPGGTMLFKYVSGQGYSVYTFDDLDMAWTPNGNATLNPGEGAFIRNPTSSDFVITFVGEVLQGSLTNTLPVGFSIKSSMVPQQGAVDSVLQFPAQGGDFIYKYIPGQGYNVYTFDDLDLVWTPSSPIINVGEAFFVRRSSAGSWVRNFNVQ